MIGLIIIGIILISLLGYVLYEIDKINKNINIINNTFNNIVGDTTIVDSINELQSTFKKGILDSRTAVRDSHLLIQTKLDSIVKLIKPISPLRDEFTENIDSMLDSIESKVLLVLNATKKIIAISKVNKEKLDSALTVLGEINYNTSEDNMYDDKYFINIDDGLPFNQEDISDPLQKLIDDLSELEDQKETSDDCCVKITKLAHSHDFPSKTKNVKLLTFKGDGN